MSNRRPEASSSCRTSKTLASWTFTLRDAVALGVPLHARDRVRGDVDREHLVGLRGDLEAEPAVVAEGVQHAARARSRGPWRGSRAGRGRGPSSAPSTGRPRSAGRSPAPRPPPAPRRGAGRRAARGPSNVRTRGSLRSRIPFGCSVSTRCADDRVLERLRGLRQGLDHEVVAVAVDHQRRQAVAFAVDDAVGLGPGGDGLAPGERGVEPLLQEVLGQRLRPRDHPQADLRAGGVEGVAEGPALLAHHAHHRAFAGAVGAGDVGAEDPGMPVDDARLALAADRHEDCGHVAHDIAAPARAERRRLLESPCIGTAARSPPTTPASSSRRS